MSDEMQIEGKPYISSKRASELSGYAQDYIGQLARKSLIDAKRIGGLWYVSMESLDAYKKKADEFKPEPPVRAATAAEPGTLVFFDGKEYLSAAKAAEMTGYAQDYVGQLSRSGTILSQQIGNRWYIDKQSILSHKKEKDALLGAVQRDSVGLSRPAQNGTTVALRANKAYSAPEPLLSYFSEEGDLMPFSEGTSEGAAQPKVLSHVPEIPKISEKQSIEIRRVVGKKPSQPSFSGSRQTIILPMPPENARRPGFPLLLGAAATIIIVLSVGYASILKQNSVYAVNIPRVPSLSALPASANTAFEEIGNILEPFLTHELTYERSSAQ